MPPDPSRRLRPRMTLRQIGVLVVFAAVAMAVLTPLIRSVKVPWAVAALAMFELPYALLVPMLLLVRRGPLKNAMVSALCAIPLGTLLVYFNYVAATGNIAPNVFIHTAFSPIYVVFAIADILLLGGLIYLVRRIIPAPCPTCGRLAMLLDPSVPRARDFPRRSPARACLACGCRFRRDRRGPWVDVDLLGDRPALAQTLTFKDRPR